MLVLNNRRDNDSIDFLEGRHTHTHTRTGTHTQIDTFVEGERGAGHATQVVELCRRGGYYLRTRVPSRWWLSCPPTVSICHSGPCIISMMLLIIRFITHQSTPTTTTTRVLLHTCIALLHWHYIYLQIVTLYYHLS